MVWFVSILYNGLLGSQNGETELITLTSLPQIEPNRSELQSTETSI